MRPMQQLIVSNDSECTSPCSRRVARMTSRGHHRDDLGFESRTWLSSSLAGLPNFVPDGVNAVDTKLDGRAQNPRKQPHHACASCCSCRRAKLAGSAEARFRAAFALACGWQHLLERAGAAGPTDDKAGLASPSSPGSLDVRGMNMHYPPAVARGIRFCRKFLHVARVKKPTAMRESRAILAWP